MKRIRLTRREVTVAAVSLLVVALAPGGAVQAHGKHKGGDPTGTWFLSTPAGQSHFYSFHEDGIVAGSISSGFGGPPRAGRAKSGDHGLWRRKGRHFEAVVWRFLYDIGTGEATTITRIRLIFRLQRGCRVGSGEFFVTQWECPAGGLECPDPNLTEPTMPEFGPPGNTFTMTRARLR